MIVNKSVAYLFILLVLISCNTSQKDKTELKSIEKNKKPNIIFILADDLGIVDIQAYAHHFMDLDTAQMFYETPHLNQLISKGTSFSQAYANPLCSPTRASILTGKNPSKLGFMTAMPLRETYYNQNLEVPDGFYPHDVLEHKDDIPIEQAWINAISNSAIPSGTEIDQGKDELTIAEALEGYHSAFIGKWHIGGFGAEGYQPKSQGFDEIAYFDAGGSPYFNWRDKWNDTSKEMLPDMPQDEWQIGDSGIDSGEEYLTDDLTQQALRFIDEKSKEQEKPFFLYFSHFAVHSPFQGIQNDIDYFDSKDSKGWNNHKDPKLCLYVKKFRSFCWVSFEKAS